MAFLKRAALPLVKLAAAIGLMVLLAHLGAFSLDELRAVFTQPTAVLVAIVLLFLALLVSAVRWRLLLQGMGMQASFGQVLRVCWIGAFASIFLLGGSGGDAVRAYYAFQAVDSDRTKPVLSVLIDRAFGMLGLFSVAVFPVALYWSTLAGNVATERLAFITLGIFAAMLIGGAGVIFLAPVVRQRLRIDNLARTRRSRRIVIDLFDAFHVLSTRFRLLLSCWGLSVAIQVLVTGSILLIAFATKAGTLHWMEYVLASTMSLLAGSIPITPGGIGVGEGLFNQLCNMMSAIAGSYGTIFLIYRICQTIVSLGGIIPLTFDRRLATTRRLALAVDRQGGPR